MKPLWLFLSLLLLVCGVGCRNRTAQELLERELRFQEDMIFRLEDQVRALAGENELLRHSVVHAPGDTPASSSKPTTPTPAAPHTPAGPDHPQQPLTPPKVEFNSSQTPIPEYQGPPSVIAPSPSFSEGELPLLPKSTSVEPVPKPLRSSSHSSAATTTPGPSMAAPLNASARSEDVRTVTVNKTETTGWNLDGVPGDEGLKIVVEPRDASGAPLAAAGAVSIVVMDPLKQGAAARLYRWDFDRQEATKAFRNSEAGPAMVFELAWPGPPPEHGQLLIFVRYTTADGRKLNADQEVSVSLPPRDTPTKPQRMTQLPPYPGMPPRLGYAAPPVARLLPPQFAPTTVGPYAPPSPAYAPPPSEPRAADAVAPSNTRTGSRWTPFR